MPSGLSYNIYENKDMSLRDFALKCAKSFNFGYIASDGGEKSLPFDAAPVIEVDKYDYDNLKGAKEKLKYWEEVSKNPEELKKNYDKENEERRNFGPRVSAAREKIRERYLDMIERVKQWVVDADFECVKEYMINHLIECIETDCPDVKYNTEYKPLPIEEWIAENIKFAKEDIGWYEEKIKKEEERVARVNDQLQRFYNNIEEFETLEKSKELRNVDK